MPTIDKQGMSERNIADIITEIFIASKRGEMGKVEELNTELRKAYTRQATETALENVYSKAMKKSWIVGDLRVIEMTALRRLVQDEIGQSKAS